MAKRKDGYYEKKKTYIINGKKVVKHFYYTDAFDLVEKIKAFENDAAESEKVYFRRVAEEWKDEHFSEVEGGTQISYKPAYNRAVDEFGKMELKDIQPLDIKRMLERLAKQKYSAQTVRVQRIVLNLIFKYAVLNGYIDINPVAAVSVPRNLPKAKRELPSEDEIDTVIDSADATFGMFAYLILFTGCRRGEALALQWKDIDFQTKTIHLYKSVNYSGDNQNVPVLSMHPKTDAGIRDVAMLACVEEKLEAIKTGQSEDDFLFGGEKPLTKSAFRRRWQAYQKETGVDFTPHQLRHAYATILYDAGIDEKVAQGLMGHSTIALTRDIYTHVRQSRLDSAAASLNQYVVGLKQNDNENDNENGEE